MNIDKLRIGQTVRVRTRGDGIVTGTVTEIYTVSEDDSDGIKNGTPGVSYRLSPTELAWCYDHQIVGVV